MAPPVALFHGRSTKTPGQSTSSFPKTIEQAENNNNSLGHTDLQTTPSTIPTDNNKPVNGNAGIVASDKLKQNVIVENKNHIMGNQATAKFINTINNKNGCEETSDSTRLPTTKRMSVQAILSGQHRNVKDSLCRSVDDSPTAVPGVECDVTENQVNSQFDPYARLGYVATNCFNTIETRRRNFSSSSLPLSLMTATIEEVEDAEFVSTSPALHSHNPPRSYSCAEGIIPSKVNFRGLRREARIPSANSPPRRRHHRPITGFTRSSSDNTDAVASLRDVDVVGESFQSRFPWQRDFGVQCDITSEFSLHQSLQRTTSGPAAHTHFRSMSLSSNSSISSPPVTAGDYTLHRFKRSCSQCDFTNSHQNFNIVDPTAYYYYHRHAAVNRSNSANNNYTAPDNNQWGTPYNSRRADYRIRPRPSSLGAADSIRYHQELTAFRELHNSRRERKSDPQLVISPGRCRKMALLFSDEIGSTSDLESILENPGDRPWDISRQTSLASFDFEDGSTRYLDVLDNHDHHVKAMDYLSRADILPSPPISPRTWATFEEDEDNDDSDDSISIFDDQRSRMRKRFRHGKQPRRLSSGSITSDAEGECNEPDPPAARRGRRPAIYETKNCGDVSPTTLSPEASPSNSCDEGEGASNIAERLRRRRSSVDLAMNIYPGDLLVQEHHKKLIKRNTIADFYAARQPNGCPLPPGVVPTNENADVIKKGRQSFSLLKLMKTKSKESLTKLGEILKRMKPSEFKDNHLAAYKSLHWSDLIASTDKQQNCQAANMSDTERKRREAVWELFKSECVFLIDHLMVLKHCFMEPLKKVQVEGSLMYAEPQDLFGNLDELSYVSYTFCKDFIAALLKDMSITDFGRTNVLLKAFQRFSAHSRDGAVYHSYCLNYTNALLYLEKLRSNTEFAEFEKWCEQDPRCNRLQLTDLLVAPMQHCTKLPLLLHNVRKYTANEDERRQVAESIEKVEASLKQLEEKMRWIKNFERVQEIQRQIVWPAVTELDPRCVIPESLKPSLSKQPCEKLLACPKRQLLHEGQVTLVETPKPLDVHLFLFDDILLITKVKKVPRKLKQLSSDTQSSGQSDRVSYVVLRQPLALDRFMLHDISASDAAASGIKHCFTLVHISRYQQITGVFTFQAPCDTTKATWLTQTREAMDGYARVASCQSNSFKDNADTKTEDKELIRARERRGESQFVCLPRRLQNGHRDSLRSVPTKSRSMDAVFI